MTPCKEWRGARMKNGYGTVGFGRTKQLAHRAAWESAHGAIPKGLFVLHRCDNRPCVRVDHLRLGTAQDNTDDMFAKGRDRASVAPDSYRTAKTLRGEAHPNTKISKKDARKIAKIYREKRASQRELAEAFGVSQPTIGRLVRGETAIGKAVRS